MVDNTFRQNKFCNELIPFDTYHVLVRQLVSDLNRMKWKASHKLTVKQIHTPTLY